MNAIAAKLIGQWSLWRVLRLLLLIYGTLCVYGWFFSNRQIFLPPSVGYGENDISLMLPVAEDASAAKLAVLSLPNPEAELTIIYSHGNGSDLGDSRSKLERIRALGFNVVAYDYQGYGLSDGKPSEANAYRDIEAVYRYVVNEQQVPPEQVIAYGQSLGGGVSVYLASQQPLGGLIVESSFVSIFRVLTQVPLIPFDKFPSLARMADAEMPVLVMHGGADRVIPFWHGQKLYEVAAEPKRSLWVKDAGHNDLMWVAGDSAGSLQGNRFDQALIEFASLVKR